MLDTAMFISNDDAKAHFRDKTRISMNRARLREAMRRDEPLSERRFLFFHGRDFTTEVVEPARRAAVEPVPNINVVVQYPQGDPWSRPGATSNAGALGVTHIQIDSVCDR